MHFCGNEKRGKGLAFVKATFVNLIYSGGRIVCSYDCLNVVLRVVGAYFRFRYTRVSKHGNFAASISPTPTLFTSLESNKLLSTRLPTRAFTNVPTYYLPTRIID